MAVEAIDEGTRGCHNLDEGIGDAVHNPAKIALGETLDPLGSDVGGAWRHSPSWRQRVGVGLGL